MSRLNSAGISTLRLMRVAAIAPFVLFVAIYLPAVGHGFIQDDYVWVLQSRVRSLGELAGLFGADNGFYRPLVSLTFAINEWIFGGDSRGYGITNLALALLCGLAIVRLVLAWGLSRGAALAASAVWLLNIYGIRMAVLWISGRTSLLVTLAAVLAATSFVRGRPMWTTLWLMAALLAKEEALLFPLVLLLWLPLLRVADPLARSRWTWTWGAALMMPLAIYGVARAGTHAMSLFDPAVYYRPTLEVNALARNIGEYANRALLVPVVTLLVGWIALGLPRITLDRRNRALLAAGVIWLVGGFGLTVFVSGRSDLYPVFPSVGASLAAIAVIDVLWRAASPAAQRRTLVVVLAALVLLSPVYWSRTRHSVADAEFAAATLEDLVQLTSDLPDDAVVIATDDRSHATNLKAAFRGLINDAYFFRTRRHLQIWIDPPVDVEDPVPPSCDSCVARRLIVKDGRLVRSAGL